MIKSSDIGFYEDSLNYILDVQSEDGSICWEKNMKLDPWDHVEAAMGLSIGGHYKAAKQAFKWMKNTQQEDGSWFAEYKKGKPSSSRKESNFTAYIATGVWHYYLITKDKDFLIEMFPVIQKAIGFVLSLQTAEGDINWAKEDNAILDDSLITGCSSIYKSIDCAKAIYKVLDYDFMPLSKANSLLKNCLLSSPERFDRSWKSKSRYSMDWYYPVMCGVVTGKEGIERINRRWDEFMVQELGCKCVKEEPWVTIAESSELVIALAALGMTDKAIALFDCLHQWKDKKDNLYWTGYVYTDDKYWPIEKPTWTAAAVLLAADTVYELTDGSELFLREWGEEKYAKVELS